MVKQKGLQVNTMYKQGRIKYLHVTELSRMFGFVMRNCKKNIPALISKWSWGRCFSRIGYARSYQYARHQTPVYIMQNKLSGYLNSTASSEDWFVGSDQKVSTYQITLNRLHWLKIFQALFFSMRWQALL